jgi:hypothetical protein
VKLVIFLFIGVAAWAQLQPPQLGVMVDRSGAARPVFGVAGSATTGPPLAAAVISSACSSQLCLFKTESSLLVWTGGVWNGGAIAAPRGPALFALNGASAYVYFPRSAQLAQWQSGKLTMLDSNVAGEILSLLATAGGTLQFAVLRNGAVSIVDQNDQGLGTIPGTPAMLIPNGAVYAASGALVLCLNDASELRWPLAGIQEFSAMGDGYVQIRTDSGSYALRVDPGREQLFMLPEIAR